MDTRNGNILTHKLSEEGEMGMTCPECENPNGIMYDHKLRTWQCVGCGAVWDRRETTTQPDCNPSASEDHCPVCGYYCLGKGGHGCIDKPANYASKTS